MIVGKSGVKIHCFGEKFIKNKKALLTDRENIY